MLVRHPVILRRTQFLPLQSLQSIETLRKKKREREREDSLTLAMPVKPGKPFMIYPVRDCVSNRDRHKVAYREWIRAVDWELHAQVIF